MPYRESLAGKYIGFGKFGESSRSHQTKIIEYYFLFIPQTFPCQKFLKIKFTKPFPCQNFLLQSIVVTVISFTSLYTASSAERYWHFIHGTVFL